MKEIGKKILISILIVLAVVFAVWVIWDNQRIVVTEIEVKSERLPEKFAGYRIAHVTDLHNDEFRKENEKLLAVIEGTKPDMIAITGDLLDSRRTDLKKAINFVQKAVQIAPCYYVTGNHESRMKEEYTELEKEMRKAGVVVLRNDRQTLERDGVQIIVAGIDDPRFVLSTDKVEKMENKVGKTLDKVLEGVPKEQFTLLLSHRPELFELYSEKKLDVVLTGHVHGGQIRIPNIGGIIGPGQGLLPDYDAGLYTKDSTKMVLSRGLGQSIIPFRLNNPPELVLVTLEKEDS